MGRDFTNSRDNYISTLEIDMYKITDRELRMLEACQTEKDWSVVCNSIKAARGNEYPDDWWEKVKMSGMMDRIMARWGADSELKMKNFNTKKDALDWLGYYESKDPEKN